ncbi:MAG: hypothetical protein DI546_04320 [Rhizobium sp.]|nr:MAG: hypothetical protein DI546_04320 [Rhizobium sp.]
MLRFKPLGNGFWRRPCDLLSIGLVGCVRPGDFLRPVFPNGLFIAAGAEDRDVELSDGFLVTQATMNSKAVENLTRRP